jgi:hypothetical protein
MTAHVGTDLHRRRASAKTSIWLHPLLVVWSEAGPWRVRRSAAAGNTRCSSRQCPQPLQWDTPPTSRAVSVGSGVHPCQRVLNLPETLFGAINQRQNCGTIRISRWVFVIEHVAQIPLAKRIGSLTTQRIKASPYRGTTIPQEANQGRSRCRCEARNCGHHDRLLRPS